MINKPTVTKTEPVKPQPTERTREVKRYKAICPWGEHPFTAFYPNRAAAEVAAARHIRVDHAASMVEPVTAIKRTRVLREVVGEEVA